MVVAFSVGIDVGVEVSLMMGVSVETIMTVGLLDLAVGIMDFGVEDGLVAGVLVVSINTVCLAVGIAVGTEVGAEVGFKVVGLPMGILIISSVGLSNRHSPCVNLPIAFILPKHSLE